MAAKVLEPKPVEPAAFLRTFSACAGDPRTLVLDVRDKKEFGKGHIAGAFCVRVSSNGSALVDYSKCEYDQRWSADCWWGKHVLVYGAPGLKRDHSVLAFLAADGHAASVGYLREGLGAVQAAHPYLVTTSLKSSAARRYPSQLEPQLYLGDWSHVEAHERLSELGVKRVITIHNNPANIKLPGSKFKHLRVELADVDTADIGPWLHPAFEFIEEGRLAGEGVLVHCGAGVSRSATLCIGALMRKHRWSAQKALEHVRSRRSVVAPNAGFWRALCALEATLGIAERSDASAFAAFHGADAVTAEEEAAASLAEPEAAKVKVTFIPAGQTSAAVGSMGAGGGVAAGGNSAAAAAAAPPPPLPSSSPRRGERQEERRLDERGSSRERQRERERRRSRSRSHERRRRGSSREQGERGRERSRERRRGVSRSRSRGGRREEPRQPAEKQPQQPQVAVVELESTPGAVLEVLREGKQLGHLVVELRKATQAANFGRLPTCEIPLEHLSISRQHAQLTTDAAGNLFLTDLASGHGTNVDGMWVRANAPKQLKVGSTLRFGASTREYRVKRLPAAPPRR